MLDLTLSTVLTGDALGQFNYEGNTTSSLTDLNGPVSTVSEAELTLRLDLKNRPTESSLRQASACLWLKF